MVRITIEDGDLSLSQIKMWKKEFDDFFYTDCKVDIDDFGVVFNG